MIAAGAAEVADIRVGNMQAIAVYAGEELVWSRPPFRITAKGSIFYTLEGTGITIDFGDGTVVTGDYHHFRDSDIFEPPQNETHTFADDAVYTVSFSGKIDLISFADLSYGGRENTGILSVLDPLPHLSKWIDEYGQDNGLLMFMGCRNLTSIPSNLFANNPDLIDLSNYFYECNHLLMIPRGLLDPCKSATDIQGLFEYCEAIQTIPAGLLDSLTEVTNIYWLFGGCTSLQDIPAGLLDHCAKITTCDGAFHGTAIASVPIHLFDNCPDIGSFRVTFQGCAGITGPVPRLWEQYTIPDSSSWQCFNGCVQATNYNDIPASWK